MKNLKTLLLVISVLASALSAETVNAFTNPLYPGEDPWVIRHDDYYYVCMSGPVNPTAVYVSKSTSLLDRGEKVKVWEDAGNYGRVFAPELHYLRGKWYIYFCADVREMGGKHMAVVLEANTDDPLDGFTNKGVLFTGDENGNAQANDITVVDYQDQLYAFWGSLGDKVFHGALVAPMDSPTKITAHRKDLGMVAEGPRAIVNGDKLIMTGATGPFASKSYDLTALIYSPEAGPIDDKDSWKHLGKVFERTDDVWGPSRASFTTSADGSENWMMYHSKVFEADDNGIRQANIQEFRFNEDGSPDFGRPVSPSDLQPLPSGDPGLGTVYQAEDWKLEGGAKLASESKRFTGEGYLTGFDKEGAKATATVEVPEAGDYRVTVRYSSGVVVDGERESFPKIYPPQYSSLSILVNGESAGRTYFHRTTDWSRWMVFGETLRLKKGANEISYQFAEGDQGEVNLDYAAVKKSATPIRGLKGSYYDDLDLSELKLTRIDPEIAFNWGESSPDPLIGPDTFSVRWEGTITPFESGEYTFYSRSDNGRRLKIDGELIIDEWTGDYDKTIKGKASLEAGKKHSIVYEYFEDGGGANTQLEWSSAQQERSIVPSACFQPAP
jgi:GH43 family beta-xylosidase